ncbi:hypothetical protein CDAR_289741 [Caerostris darwini]|uniref:Cytochrome c biogenesis B n=1 Tax=Caerostris darwini TaxID=1538125 RepID=A0AAV4WY88_9ARAC|nr:hypothetical protein CDAR_289741 [Caerostris darwini]
MIHRLRNSLNHPSHTLTKFISPCLQGRPCSLNEVRYVFSPGARHKARSSIKPGSGKARIPRIPDSTNDVLGYCCFFFSLSPCCLLSFGVELGVLLGSIRRMHRKQKTVCFWENRVLVATAQPSPTIPPIFLNPHLGSFLITSWFKNEKYVVSSHPDPPFT